MKYQLLFFILILAPLQAMEEKLTKKKLNEALIVHMYHYAIETTKTKEEFTKLEERVKKLLADGADINAKLLCPNRRYVGQVYLLNHAINYRNHELCELLLKNNARMYPTILLDALWAPPQICLAILKHMVREWTREKLSSIRLFMLHLTRKSNTDKKLREVVRQGSTLLKPHFFVELKKHCYLLFKNELQKRYYCEGDKTLFEIRPLYLFNPEQAKSTLEMLLNPELYQAKFDQYPYPKGW